MQLSTTELQILNQLAKGTTSIQGIATNLNKDQSWIYKRKQSLLHKGIIQFNQGKIQPTKHTHVALLLQLLNHHPTLITLLADSGIPLLMALLNHTSTIKDLEQLTSYKKSIIYKKLQQATNQSIVVQTKQKTYALNTKIWQDLIMFLKELQRYEQTTDPRIPAASTIYHKKAQSILFSTSYQVDAAITGFSAYAHYGITLRLPTIYYYLPKKPLTRHDVFLHSLIITEKDTSIRHITYVALFYLKYNNKVQAITHPILTNIKQVLKGKTLQGYPTKEEIQEKAELYDIRF